MIISALTQTPVTGTGIINIQGRLFGGYKLNTDGTNIGTLIIRSGSSVGNVLINTKTAIGEHVVQPMRCDGAVYYSVSGVNVDLMIFEAIRETV